MEVAAGAWRRYQMPAYHLIAPRGEGISLVNIGVGPSNAKTICDHLAVMRPEVWLMIGHCGGLRPSQTIGDYVLAHAYLRDDHVMDDVLPVEVPIPAIAEIQQALVQAAVEVTGEDSQAIKRRLRTGTVVTTDDRNWELRFTLSALRFNQSRAAPTWNRRPGRSRARFGSPTGTLLALSDPRCTGELPPRCPSRQCLFTNGRSASTANRHRKAANPASGGRQTALPQLSASTTHPSLRPGAPFRARNTPSEIRVGA